jgi:3-oxoacyl-[acyl-carrier-protein] synthase III
VLEPAEAAMRCGKTVADVDVYVPHQANVRIIDHATRKSGFLPER